MIHKLIIRNFQKHELLKISLDPNITTIIGPTDVGKSAILRSLKWLALNLPRGESFLRQGADKVRVSIHLELSHITRTKGKQNTYHLDGRKFKAFGLDVPKEIATVLNLSEVNFQDQHDPSFWISEGPAEVSRRLNDVVDLSVIDSTLANLSRTQRKITVECDVVESRLTEAKLERKKFKRADKIHLELLHLERQVGKTAEKAQRLSLLASLVSEVAEYRDKSTRLLEASVEGQNLINCGEKWEKLHSTANQLSLLLTYAREAEHYASVEIPDLDPLEKAVSKVETLKKQVATLFKLLEDYHDIFDLKGYFENLAKQHEKMLKEAMGATCAFCGQMIPSSQS